MNRLHLTLLLFALTAVALLLFKPGSTPERAPLAADALVLAFGDSLTYGYGASPEESYPAQLVRSSALRVINAGIPGELSEEGLRRLPGLLQEHKPALVILTHGGNDILRKMPRTALKENLRQMVRLCQEAGAEVLLVGVPDFNLFGFKPPDLYEEVADEFGTLYEGDVICGIVADTRLKSDRVHPNAEGYRLMAEKFYEVLKEEGLL